MVLGQVTTGWTDDSWAHYDFTATAVLVILFAAKDYYVLREIHYRMKRHVSIAKCKICMRVRATVIEPLHCGLKQVAPETIRTRDKIHGHISNCSGKPGA